MRSKKKKKKKKKRVWQRCRSGEVIASPTEAQVVRPAAGSQVTVHVYDVSHSTKVAHVETSI